MRPEIVLDRLSRLAGLGIEPAAQARRASLAGLPGLPRDRRSARGACATSSRLSLLPTSLACAVCEVLAINRALSLFRSLTSAASDSTLMRSLSRAAAPRRRVRLSARCNSPVKSTGSSMPARSRKPSLTSRCRVADSLDHARERLNRFILLLDLAQKLAEPEHGRQPHHAQEHPRADRKAWRSAVSRPAN